MLLRLIPVSDQVVACVSCDELAVFKSSNKLVNIGCFHALVVSCNSLERLSGLEIFDFSKFYSLNLKPSLLFSEISENLKEL